MCKFHLKPGLLLCVLTRKIALIIVFLVVSKLLDCRAMLWASIQSFLSGEFVTRMNAWPKGMGTSPCMVSNLGPPCCETTALLLSHHTSCCECVYLTKKLSNWKCHHCCFADMCSNEIITDMSGTIQSPGYGLQYPNYASCNWAIQVEEGYNIRLSFAGFDLETGRDTLSIVGSRGNSVGPLVRIVIMKSLLFKIFVKLSSLYTKCNFPWYLFLAVFKSLDGILNF